MRLSKKNFPVPRTYLKHIKLICFKISILQFIDLILLKQSNSFISNTSEILEKIFHQISCLTKNV